MEAKRGGNGLEREPLNGTQRRRGLSVDRCGHGERAGRARRRRRRWWWGLSW